MQGNNKNILHTNPSTMHIQFYTWKPISNAIQGAMQRCLLLPQFLFYVLGYYLPNLENSDFSKFSLHIL
jgi:hypothetical protein